MGEQAVQHCQLIAGDSNREEQARHHEHPRTATAGQGGCGSFPSLNLPALQMHRKQLLDHRATVLLCWCTFAHYAWMPV